MKSDGYFEAYIPARHSGQTYMIKIQERGAGRKAYEERKKAQNMRVTVYNTDGQEATVYYDVEQILFDKDNTATLIFYTGETKKFLPTEYTYIDYKRKL